MSRAALLGPGHRFKGRLIKGGFMKLNQGWLKFIEDTKEYVPKSRFRGQEIESLNKKQLLAALSFMIKMEYERNNRPAQLFKKEVEV